MKCDTIPDLEKFLAIQEQALGATTPEVAATLTKLAELYLAKGDLDRAELMFQRSFEIRAEMHGFHRQGIEHLELRLNEIRAAKGRSRSNQPTSTATDTETIPTDMPATSYEPTMSTVNTLAGISSVKSITGAIQEAEIELELLKQMVGPEHPSVADVLTKIADLYCRIRAYNKMEPLLADALKIREAVCGMDHPSVATELKNLGSLYLAQQRYALAEPLLKRAITLRERAYGCSHPRVADVEAQYALLLRKTSRDAQAEALERHVNDIRSESTPFSCDSSFFGAAMNKPRR